MTQILPNCGVVAVANVVGQPTDTMMQMFRTVNKRTSRWRGRTSHKERCAVLRHLNVDFTHKRGSGSLASWVENHTAKNKKYIVTVSGHVVYVCNGIVSDQHETKPAPTHNCRRKRVKHFIEVA